MTLEFQTSKETGYQPFRISALVTIRLEGGFKLFADDVQIHRDTGSKNEMPNLFQVAWTRGPFIHG